MNLTWSDFKQLITLAKLKIQYIEKPNLYELKAFNSLVLIAECIIEKIHEDCLDFETNFKAISNRPLEPISQPFDAKVLPDGKRIFRRVRGISGQVQNVPINIDFTIPYTNCKITGVQILGAKLGDKATFQILDTDTGTISGVPNAVLNTFGQNVYIASDKADYPSKYDADLIAGLKLRVIYDAIDELLPRNIYINFDLHEVIT